jgi:hypothetical protein
LCCFLLARVSVESDDDLDEFDFNDASIAIQEIGETDELWNSISLAFNPYQCQLSKLEVLSPLNQSKFGVEVKEMALRREQGEEFEQPAQVKQLQDFIVSDIDGQRDTKWATMLESLITSLPPTMTYLRSHPSQRIKEQHFMSIVSEWACYAISIDHARSLPLAINIRLLKAGMSVSQLLASACEEYQVLLVEHGIHACLMDLLMGDHVASSLKLQVIRTLDATTNCGITMDAFMGWSIKNEPELCEENISEKPAETAETSLSPYEKLLDYLVKEPTVRVITAIKQMLVKAHTYEAISTLQEISSLLPCSEKLKTLSVGTASDNDSKQEEIEKNSSVKLQEELDGVGRNTPVRPGGTPAITECISEEDFDSLKASLVAIHESLQDEFIFAQPSVRAFPTTVKLDSDAPTSCRSVIFEFLSSRRYLASIAMIASTPLLSDPNIFIVVRDTLLLLLSFYEGVMFLSTKPSTVNALIKSLLNQSDAADLESYASLHEVLSNKDALEDCTAHHLGLLLVYHLQALQGVDQLTLSTSFNMPILEMDSAEHLSILHAIYTMAFYPIGRDAIASTFSMGDNLKCLLYFLSGGEDMEVKMKKSVSSRYASML